MTQPNQMKLLRMIQIAIIHRAESKRINPDDSHGINTAVYVSLMEVSDAIDTVLELAETMRSNPKGKP